MTDKQVSPDRGIRWLTAAAVLVVASIAAVVSFIHIEHLAATNGQDALTAILLPDQRGRHGRGGQPGHAVGGPCERGARAQAGPGDARPRGHRDPGG